VVNKYFKGGGAILISFRDFGVFSNYIHLYIRCVQKVPGMAAECHQSCMEWLIFVAIT
jgi:hypothetical protein